MFEVSTCASASGQLQHSSHYETFVEKVYIIDMAFLSVKFLQPDGGRRYRAVLYVHGVLQVNRRRASWVVVVAVCIHSSQRTEIFSSLSMSIFELSLCSNILSQI